MSENDGGWIAQARRIAERPLRPSEEIQLRFAIGKYFDDVGNFEQAFDSYRRANELTKHHRLPHDRRQLTQVFESTIGFHSGDWVNRVRHPSNPSSRPVFVVGMPRSGTSLAEQILASHPAVFGAGEIAYWKAVSGKVAATGGEGQSSDIELCQMADDYLRLLAELSADELRVVDKMPSNFMHLGLIHAALPGARIIHMRRNPIDTCLSIYFQNFHRAHTYANDLEDLAHCYLEYLRIMQHWRAILPADAMLEVPYEELVADQETWSRRMVEFIGLPWDPACLEFHRTRRSVNTFSKWQVRQKISSASVERWRNYAPFLGPLLGLTGAASEA